MFLSPGEAADVRERFGTPCYVYDRRTLESAARTALAFPAPFGFTLRYAMKANPSAAILRIFRDFGLHIDASSDHEVERALRIGVPADTIQLTSQMPSRSLEDFVARGVRYNACSLYQLEPRRPASSPVCARKRIDRFGRCGDSETRLAISSKAAIPDASSSAPL